MNKAFFLLRILTAILSFDFNLSFSILPLSPQWRSGNTHLECNVLSSCPGGSEGNAPKPKKEMHVFSRRKVLNSIGSGTIVGAMSNLILPNVAHAKETKSDTSSGVSLVSAEELAEKLRAVPTFTIVDKSGAPYAVVGEDAKLSTYFFTTYEEAKRILGVAADSYEKTKAQGIKEANVKRAKQKLPPLTTKQIEEEFGKNPWKYARISSIALDLAVSLSIKASGKRTGAYFYVQSSEDDVQDALALSKDKIKDLAEGKVPLFYMENMKLSKTQSPVYFNKMQLIEEWKKQNPAKSEKDMPEILVSELFSLIFEMVKPGAEDKELKTIVFVPPENSEQKAEQCNKAGEGAAPFKLGERIIVL